MTQQKSIKRNFIMNVILAMSSFIFPLITYPYISRVLRPAGMGKISFASSFISYFSMIAQLGMPTYGVRTCAQVRDDRKKLTQTVHELLAINLIMDAVSYAGLFLALALIPSLKEDRTLYVIVSSTILLTSIGMEWLYKALEQYTYITVRSIVFKIIAIIAMFLLVHTENDYVIYGAISIFASSASNIMNFFNARHYVDKKAPYRLNLKKHWKPVFIFFAMSAANLIYTNLDVVMLRFLTTASDVGYYDTALRFKNVLTSLVISLGTVLLPRASYNVEKGNINEFERLNQKSVRFIFLFSFSLMIFFIVYARECIYFLSGDAYAPAIRPMQLIMLTLVFIGLSNITGTQILVPLGKEQIVLYSEIAGAVTDFILNAFLIPVYQSSGAAIGTIAAEFMVLIYQTVYLKKNGKVIFNHLPFGRMIVSLVLALLASVWLKGTSLPYFLILLISALLFFGVYFIALLLFKEPIAIEIKNTILKKLHIA